MTEELVISQLKKQRWKLTYRGDKKFSWGSNIKSCASSYFNVKQVLFCRPRITYRAIIKWLLGRVLTATSLQDRLMQCCITWADQITCVQPWVMADAVSLLVYCVLTTPLLYCNCYFSLICEWLRTEVIKPVLTKHLKWFHLLKRSQDSEDN